MKRLTTLAAITFLSLALIISLDASSQITLYGRQVVAPIGDDTDGFLHIQTFSISIPQGSGSAQILSIKNNMLESSTITATGKLGFVNTLEVHPIKISLGEVCAIHLDYDTSETEPGEYALNLVIEANSETSSVVLYREIRVKVTNVAPTVDAGSDQTVKINATVNFAGSFTDPGMLDTHTIEWDFGDGSTATGTLTPSHAYTSVGNYMVTLKVRDGYGGVGTDTVTITVEG